MENVDSQVELLESKRDGYAKQLTFIITEKETLNSTISELTKGLANNVIQYKDKETGQIITTTSSTTRKVLEKQLDNAIERQEIVNGKSEELNTTIFDLENDILETKLGNDSASELSTLKYLADVTGGTMDDVMKWFILLLIVIGDPMAVLMVIVFNKVVKSDNDVERLPMDDLIGDNPPEPNNPITEIPKGIGPDSEYNKIMGEQFRNHNKVKPIVDPVTGHIDLPEEALPMEKDIFIGNGEPKSDYAKQIQDNIRRGVPIVNEHVELVEEPIVLGEDIGFDPEPIEEVSHNEQAFNEMIEGGLKEGLIPVIPMDSPDGTGLVSAMDIVDEDIVNTPAEQIEENVEDVKQLKREAIIPRGKIIESDVIKGTDRGFSVKVPDPKVIKVGSQKEIREDKPNVFFFKRKRGDELGD